VVENQQGLHHLENHNDAVETNADSKSLKTTTK
jgi:hypothetical protein